MSHTFHRLSELDRFGNAHSAASEHFMAVSNSDLTELVFLDCIEQGSGLPDGCDSATLTERGLAALDPKGLSLTARGQSRLAKLRSNDD